MIDIKSNLIKYIYDEYDIGNSFWYFEELVVMDL